METFGERLQKLRKSKNMTQEDLASKVNVSPQAVSKWETDMASPDITLLSKLADIFDITIDELLGREVKKEVTTINEESKKDYKKRVLRILVDSNDGDHVKINFPVQLILAFKDLGKLPSITNGNNETIKSIDWETVFSLLEEGVVGELISIDSNVGDKVKIVVE